MNKLPAILLSGAVRGAVDPFCNTGLRDGLRLLPKGSYMAGYSEEIEVLKRSLQDVRCLHEATNPVLAWLRSPSANGPAALDALRQYAFLPATIVEFLTIGMQRLSLWGAVAAELQRNRSEELGSRTSGMSHYEILSRRIHENLGIHLADSRPSPATLRFIRTMRRDLWTQSNPMVAGILYALEASAGPELLVVAHILNEVSRLNNRPALIDVPHMLSDDPIDSGAVPVGEITLSDFMALHIRVFEAGHEAGLEAAGAHHIAEYFLPDFGAGFRKLTQWMEHWWDEMTAELQALAAEPGRPESAWKTNLTRIAL